MHLNKQLREKTRESMASVLPITAIVFLLSITIAPLDPGTLVLFLFGAVLLIGGMGLFTQNGIKKPSYIAMQMLRRLGGTLRIHRA